MVLIKYLNFDGTIGYYRMWTGRAALEDVEHIKKIFFGQSRYDIRPTQVIDVFTVDPRTGKYHVQPMNWGLFPKWSPKKPILFARLETVDEKPFWQGALQERRCIIPVSHFYEWQERAGSAKHVPWIIKRTGHDFMFFPGIWAARKNAEGKDERVEVAILTQEGNKLMHEIHNHGGNIGRQPVFIDEDKIPLWLDPDLKDPQRAKSLLRSIEDGEYEAQMLEESGNDATHTPPKPRQPDLF